MVFNDVRSLICRPASRISLLLNSQSIRQLKNHTLQYDTTTSLSYQAPLSSRFPVQSPGVLLYSRLYVRTENFQMFALFVRTEACIVIYYLPLLLWDPVRSN